MKHKFDSGILIKLKKYGCLTACLVCLLGIAGCSIRLASSVVTASPTAVAASPAVTATPERTSASPSVTPSVSATPLPASTTEKPISPAVPTQTPEPTATPVPTSVPEPEFWVNLKIEGPEGTLFSEQKFETEANATVFTVLQSFCEKKGIPMDYSGSVKRGTVYVRGIDGFFEKMYGGRSGWTYYVNGEMPPVSSSSYKMKKGDTVEWRYVK